MRFPLVALLFLLTGYPTFASPPVDYTGHYELADTKADHVFAIDITQTGSNATISFSAAMNDGSGAAPDADGQGQIGKSGNLTFTFKDSFDNEGTGTLQQKPDGYHLTLTATKVLEPRCLRHYGNLLLKKTSAKPDT